MLAEILEHVDVLFVAASALDQPDGATAGELLDVIHRRLVEIDDLDEFQNAVIDVEDRHVAAEAAGQGCGCNSWFSHFL